MANSEGFEEALQTMVVNCFQISNFVLWQTANLYRVDFKRSCELLSN